MLVKLIAAWHGNQVPIILTLSGGGGWKTRWLQLARSSQGPWLRLNTCITTPSRTQKFYLANICMNCESRRSTARQLLVSLQATISAGFSSQSITYRQRVMAYASQNDAEGDGECVNSMSASQMPFVLLERHHRELKPNHIPAPRQKPGLPKLFSLLSNIHPSISPLPAAAIATLTGLTAENGYLKEAT